jgi:nucleoside-diphosphate-sugar epimerase
MHIFVTGASGFVGGAITAALSVEHDVSCMSRTQSSDDVILAAGGRPLRCVLGAVPKDLLSGCDVVVHAAAFVGDWGSRDDYWQANVVGTEQLLKAAKAAGVKRFIHIGTEAALWYGQHMVDIDETSPYARDSPYLYAQTKAEAEILVLEANSAVENFTTLALRPRMIWGPGDQTILPAIQNMVESGKFVWINHGKALTSTTHIRNLVSAVELALDNGRGGEPYFITDGESSTLKHFLTQLLATVAVTPPEKSLPRAAVYPAAVILEGFWRLIGITSAPPLTRHAVGLMACDCTLIIDKATRELGYRPKITVEQGMAELTSSLLELS